jgi:hypothetical protein
MHRHDEVSIRAGSKRKEKQRGEPARVVLCTSLEKMIEPTAIPFSIADYIVTQGSGNIISKSSQIYGLEAVIVGGQVRFYIFKGRLKPKLPMELLVGETNVVQPGEGVQPTSLFHMCHVAPTNPKSLL